MRVLVVALLLLLTTPLPALAGDRRKAQRPRSFREYGLRKGRPWQYRLRPTRDRRGCRVYILERTRATHHRRSPHVR